MVEARSVPRIPIGVEEGFESSPIRREYRNVRVALSTVRRDPYIRYDHLPHPAYYNSVTNHISLLYTLPG